MTDQELAEWNLLLTIPGWAMARRRAEKLTQEQEDVLKRRSTGWDEVNYARGVAEGLRLLERIEQEVKDANDKAAKKALDSRNKV